MSYRCLHCGSPLSDTPPTLALTNKSRRGIYTALREAEGALVPHAELLVAMYPGDKMPTPSGYGVMRVNICEINKLLEPLKWRICSHREEGYFLAKYPKKMTPKKIVRRKKHNGTTAQEAAESTDSEGGGKAPWEE